MPARLRRAYGTGYLHFITFSCYQRRPLLGAPQCRDLFLRILEETRSRYGIVVVGYVIMPEHVHLLLSEPEQSNHSVVLQVLKQRFARELLEQYLFARLHELLYSSLLAENEARLEHLESAVQRLERKSGELFRRRNVLRQEEITEEIEVIMLSAEMMI